MPQVKTFISFGVGAVGVFVVTYDLNDLHTWYIDAGLGSILDTVSKDTEDTAHLYLFNVSSTHFQAFLLMVSVSKYLKDTEDTAYLYLLNVP